MIESVLSIAREYAVWAFWILIPLAFIRGLMRIEIEGWWKAIVTLLLWGAGFGFEYFTEYTYLIPALVGAFCLLILNRPSLSAISDRLAGITAHVTAGLGLECVPGIMPLDQLGEAFRSAGGSQQDALEVVNAYAVRHEQANLLLVSPAGAILPTDELYFLVAHEVGHHFLGHTAVGFLGKVLQWLQSPIGMIVGVGAGVLLGAPFWAMLAGGGLFKLFGRQLSQEDEHAADEFATRRLVEMGIDPTAGLRLMDKFARFDAQSELGQVVESLFGTHPSSKERKARIIAEAERVLSEPVSA